MIAAEHLAAAYDANGNATQVGAKSFTYDAENHLTGMTTSGTVVSIIYDAFGNRVAKTVNGVTTKYLVEDDVNPTGYAQVVEELVGGAVTRQYTYGLQRISQQQFISNTWTPSFYGYDGGGNVRQLTSSAGAVTDTYEYDAFGNSFTKQGTTPNNYLYRGEQYDSDLGLYYLRARYYNPATGRFLSRDPENGRANDPASLHKYLYAGGNPVNLIDPSGRDIATYAKTTLIVGGSALSSAELFLGGTAESIAEWMAELEAGIAEISELLAEAGEDLANNALDAATDLIEEAIGVYEDLLREESSVGALTRYFSCEIVGLSGSRILELVGADPKLVDVVKVVVTNAACAYAIR
jgi:RHS repeat-associated protein